MTLGDICLFLQLLHPDLELEYFDNIGQIYIWHLEEKIRQEVLHLDVPYDHKNLALASPYDEIYWTYLLSMLYLEQGKMELYREYRKMFEAAWENLCHQVFAKKENFKLAPWFPGNEERA